MKNKTPRVSRIFSTAAKASNGELVLRLQGGILYPWIILLVMLFLLPTPLFAKQDGAASPISSGEIFCSGTVRYALGAGNWLSKTQGTSPVVLPLKVETGETAGRVTIPGLGIFEGQKNTLFTLSLDKDGALILTVTHGSVLYSLRPEVRLCFVPPVPEVKAFIGFTSSTKSSLWTPGSLLLGEITVESDNVFHVFNLNGDATIWHEGKTVQNVATGHALQVIYLKPQEAVPADDLKLAFMPMPDGGKLLFKEQYRPNNWNLVLQYPQSSAPVKKWHALPPVDDYEGPNGGYVYYNNNNNNNNNDKPHRQDPQDASPTLPPSGS